MRVLQIGLSNFPGGIEAFVMTYFRQLVNRGVVFDFVDIYGDGIAFENEIKSLGGKIYYTPNYKKHPIKAEKKMEEIIKENGYQIVHINMLSAANLLPLKATKRAGKIAVVHAHNNNTHGIVRSFMHKYNSKRLKKMDAVCLACSKDSGKWMFQNKDFQVIPNAISAEKFSFSQDSRLFIRNQLGLSTDDLVIGFCGRLDKQKNPLYLINILHEVKIKRSDSKAKLLIVGDGELKQDVIDYAIKMGVKEDVIFAGIQRNVAPWYSAMDCFVLPSVYEGFGIVCIEAQACGLPCFVSTAVSAEVNITDNVKYLPLDNLSAWGDNISNVRTSKKVEERNNNVLNTQYDIDKSASQLYEVYIKAMTQQ